MTNIEQSNEKRQRSQAVNADRVGAVYGRKRYYV